LRSSYNACRGKRKAIGKNIAHHIKPNQNVLLLRTSFMVIPFPGLL
jgi:hypothetical protein